VSTATSAGTLSLCSDAAFPTAPRKQADQPAAKGCSGLAPGPFDPGGDRRMSRLPSELRDAPSRPPVVWVLPV